MITLAVASDSTLHSSIGDLFMNGKATTRDFCMLVGTPPFDKAKSQRVGKILYGIANQMLEKIEVETSSGKHG